MHTAIMQFGEKKLNINFPIDPEIYLMPHSKPICNPQDLIEKALVNSIGSPGLDQVITEKLGNNPDGKAVIVVSDNTRPVPYQGETGILWPVIKRLLAQKIDPKRIFILVATGTHRALSEEELRKMLDPRVFEYGITVKNHDCRNERELVFLGITKKRSKVFVNNDYVNADLKILTGLVESHFMAGVSGGRKSICPGLVGEASTYIFHGPTFLASSNAQNLMLEGNPCHDEALEVAKMAGVDYIVNVTLDNQLNLTGVFAGDLEKAHQKAVEQLKKEVLIPMVKEYDIVVTHAGFVGINHYQAAKAGVVSIPALKPNGYLILMADNTDNDPVGSQNYRTALHLLKLMGAEKFNRLLLSPEWSFIPDQWQVQMWARLFTKIPPDNFIYFSPQLSRKDFGIIPCLDGNLFLPMEERYHGTLASIPIVVEKAIQETIKNITNKGQKSIDVAYLTDGPYGIVTNDETVVKY
jgi:nickel-dependent lactate racemase